MAPLRGSRPKSYPAGTDGVGRGADGIPTVGNGLPPHGCGMIPSQSAASSLFLLPQPRPRAQAASGIHPLAVTRAPQRRRSRSRPRAHPIGCGHHNHAKPRRGVHANRWSRAMSPIDRSSPPRRQDCGLPKPSHRKRGDPSRLPRPLAFSRRRHRGTLPAGMGPNGPDPVASRLTRGAPPHDR